MNPSDSAGMDRMRPFKCEIVGWIADDPQPGIVEARITDADGRQWSFLDKVAIFDFRGALPETGASTVERLGERPLAARERLVAHLEGREIAAAPTVSGAAPVPLRSVAV